VALVSDAYRPRSARDRERILYEGERAAACLRLQAFNAAAGNPPVAAEATASIANDLERALQGKATAFDFAGGRGEWKSKQKEASNA
jgi:hypothetical protein